MSDYIVFWMRHNALPKADNDRLDCFKQKFTSRHALLREKKMARKKARRINA